MFFIVCFRVSALKTLIVWSFPTRHSETWAWTFSVSSDTNSITSSSNSVRLSRFQSSNNSASILTGGTNATLDKTRQSAGEQAHRMEQKGRPYCDDGEGLTRRESEGLGFLEGSQRRRPRRERNGVISITGKCLKHIHYYKFIIRISMHIFCIIHTFFIKSTIKFNQHFINVSY